jgi:hypothetical protein
LENDMPPKQIVLAIFPDEASADAAATTLKSRGAAKGDAIGVLVLDEHGEVKTDKVGSHSAGKGAGIGLVLGLLGPVGIVAGTVGGSLLGLLHHKGLGLTGADRDRVAAELQDGKAAVGVLAGESEALSIEAELSTLGGAVEIYHVTDEVLDEAAASIPDSVAPHIG